MQADQLGSELVNLLKINEMYQDTIKELESVVERKDGIIAENLSVISKLTKGGEQELKDIRNMFFSK